MFSCTQRKPSKTVVSAIADTASKKQITSLQRNAIDSLQLPNSFVLDNTFQFDSLRHAEIQIVLPKCINNPNLNRLVSLYFGKRLQNFIASLDTLIQQDSSMLIAVPSGFYVDPVSVYSDSNIVSYCFIVSTDRAGNAHPFTEYYSFNYDRKANKQVKFFDYFHFTKKQDSASLKEMIANSIYKANPDVNKTFIDFDRLYDIDFNVDADSIAFNFDDYEIGSYALGIVKAKANKESLKQFVKNEYR